MTDLNESQVAALEGISEAIREYLANATDVTRPTLHANVLARSIVNSVVALIPEHYDRVRAEHRREWAAHLEECQDTVGGTQTVEGIIAKLRAPTLPWGVAKGGD